LKEKIYFELESLTLHCQKCGCESTEETVNEECAKGTFHYFIA
jgi:hypothetical protein